MFPVKLLYTSSNPMMVTHLRNLLQSEGVECRLKNEFLYSIAGEVPPTMIWPELWVAESDFDRAQRVVNEALADKSGLPPWRCAECGEQVEGQFDLCWQCGAPRPAVPN